VRKLLLVVTLLGVALCGLIYAVCVADSPAFAAYKRIHVGMSIDEVQAVLGPGTRVNQEQVPTTVVAVNPADAEASRERARRAGGPPQTARDYPARHQPFVEGDYILRWEIRDTGAIIFVAFKDGKVCGKHYYDPNDF
jgi:hypothetical protein